MSTIPATSKPEAASMAEGEVLYNGIRLPAEWPPQRGKLSREPMPVPYLAEVPAVIPIETGRQLLVDDFLIDQTDLRRTFHQPEYHADNPVVFPDQPWEQGKRTANAMVFSDGVWYDPQAQLFKMWYQGPDNGSTCFATSSDGIHWEKPSLDVRQGTNIVLEAPRDSVTVWLDHEEPNPDKRFKLFRAHATDKRIEGDSRYKKWQISVHESADGIHWRDVVYESGPSWDRTTVFWNPFRRVWVFGVRGHEWSRGTNFRVRLYKEAPDLAAAARWEMSSDAIAEGEWAPGEPVTWVGADRLDLHHATPEFSGNEPELYNLDAVAYESLLLGLFTIWQGPSNDDCHRLGIEKRNQLFVGFSRDGFHWDRPDRRAFLPVNDVSAMGAEQDNAGAWNRSNVQSAGGVCLVVGDKLYFYCSGRTYGQNVAPANSTGLALLRRDGFASMDAGEGEGVLTTRLLRFPGKHLFVNVDGAGGSISAEVLDADGNVILPFTRAACVPIRADTTCAEVRWQTTEDLSTLAGEAVRLRFYVQNASFYSFWISPDASGASYGYVAAGGPGLTGPVDTVGSTVSS